MQCVKYAALAVCIVLLSACVSASDKQFNLAQESVKSGSYQQAFDQAAQSLQADISNKKTIALFPVIVRGAYAQKLNNVEHAQATAHWDDAAHGYDRLIHMNQTIKHIQLQLGAYSQKVQGTSENRKAMNTLLGLQGQDVNKQRDIVYQKAAEAHYVRGNQLRALQQHRQASHEFNQTLSFIADYKDTLALAAKSKHLADLADANKFYKQGVQSAGLQNYRAAQRTFEQAESFIAGFKDARNLALKYKTKADLADALKYYHDGQQLAQQHQYRPAAKAFQAALGFVPGYRDAVQLSAHYIDLANQEDALRYYNRGVDLMDQQQFAAAAVAFSKANNVVWGFRDARMMADKAKSLMPPERSDLKALIQASVQHGIPLTWLHDVHQGFTEDVKITYVRVLQRGYFNRHGEYWPYRLSVQGTCQLETPNNPKQNLTFDTVVDYRIGRDDFGGRKAMLQKF